MDYKFILDQTSQGEESSTAVKVTASINFDNEILTIEGKQVSKTIAGKSIETGLPAYYSHRGKEVNTYPNQAPEAQAKVAAKKVLADTFLNAVDTAMQAYLKGVFDLENPTTVEEGGE